jgi:hypothetical protein
MTRLILSLAVGIAISSIAADGHHSIAAVYDGSRQVTIEGVVAQFQFVNPHPFVMVDVKDRSGQSQQWRLELDNRSELAAIGVTADTLKPGDRIVAAGSPARAQSHGLYVYRLDRPADGFRYEQIGFSPRIRTPSR